MAVAPLAPIGYPVRPALRPDVAQTPRTVTAARTPASLGEVRKALAVAYRRLHGGSAPDGLLDVLTAQVAHETARGDKMFNYNFGGIKGAGPGGLTARLRTTEVSDGRRREIVDSFRAYRSLEDGATDYLRLLETRYGEALARAGEGDVEGFASALKERRYFTAPLEEYASALHAHLRQGLADTGGSLRAQIAVGARYLYGAELAAEAVRLDGQDPGALPTTAEVARVIGSVSALAARIGDPIDDDGQR